MVATIKLLSIKKVSTLKFWGELSLEGGGGGFSALYGALAAMCEIIASNRRECI